MGFDVQKIKQKLFHRDSDSNEEDFIEEDGYSSGDVSYDDTDPAERAKTVKKKLIMVGVGAVAIFAAASVASNALFSGGEKGGNAQQQTGPTGTVTAGTPADAFPAKYSEIAQTQGKQQTNGHNHAAGPPPPGSPYRRLPLPRWPAHCPRLDPDAPDRGIHHRFLAERHAAAVFRPAVDACRSDR